MDCGGRKAGLFEGKRKTQERGRRATYLYPYSLLPLTSSTIITAAPSTTLLYSTLLYRTLAHLTQFNPSHP